MLASVKVYPTWSCAQRISVSPVCRYCGHLCLCVASCPRPLSCHTTASAYTTSCPCSFSHSLCALYCLLCLITHVDHAWRINGFTRTLSGPCGGLPLATSPQWFFQHLMSTIRHSLLTGRQQHDSPGASDLWRLQHRPCPSMLLHRCGTHTVRDMMLTHRLTPCRWMPLLSLFRHPPGLCRPVPFPKMLPLSFPVQCFPSAHLLREPLESDGLLSWRGWLHTCFAGTAGCASSNVPFSFYGPAWTSVTSWPG